MEKQILISYHLASRSASCVVPVNYSLEKSGNAVQIQCSIAPEDSSTNGWLRIRKFEMRALSTNGRFSLLYNDRNNVQTLDATLFIEEAYTLIMKKERLALQPAEAGQMLQ